MLLSILASFVNELAALAGTLVQLLAFVLDFAVKALENRQDGALECLCRFGV